MKYNEYKSFEYDWLPQIPKHWRKESLRGIFSLSDERKNDLNEIPLLSVYREYGVIPKNSRNDNHNVESEDTSKYKVVKKTDLVINKMKLWQGSLGISEYNGFVSPAYIVCHTSTHHNLMYINLLLRSASLKTYYNRISYGIRVGQWDSDYHDFRKLFIPVPPREEQDQIVRYLDWQLSKIKKLIHGYQREIKLLEERKKSLITYMVTHDRHSDERKASEIYWLTDVPASWRVTRLKHILQKQDRPIPENAELLICSNHGYVAPRGDNKLGLVAENDDIYQGVKKGDLLIHGMDTWHGAIAISNYDGMCTPVVHVCTSTESPRFICYYLRMMAFTKVFKAISNGVRQNTSDFRSWDKAGALYIALPSVEEQEIIADIIDVKISDMDRGIEKLKKQIEVMHEYRTRLISDVVTGQMDVRGIEIPDYVPEEENTADLSDETDEENETAGEEAEQDE